MANDALEDCAGFDRSGCVGSGLTAVEISCEIAALLKRILSTDDIDASGNFFMAGGDSLAATELVAAIEQRFGVNLEIVEIFERPDIPDFAQLVKWHLDNPVSADPGEVSPIT